MKPLNWITEAIIGEPLQCIATSALDFWNRRMKPALRRCSPDVGLTWSDRLRCPSSTGVSVSIVPTGRI